MAGDRQYISEPVRAMHLGTMLSIATGFMLAPNVSELHGAVEYMAGHAVWAHQLPREMKACAPHLLSLHPWLSEIETPSKFNGIWHAERFVAELVFEHGRKHLVTPVPGGTHIREPLGELVEMVREMGREPEHTVIVVTE